MPEAAMISPGSPLDNFPLVRTSDPEVVRGALARIYAEPKVRLAQPGAHLDALMNECELKDVKLGYSAYGTALSLEFPTADYFVQLLPVRGKGEVVLHDTPLPLTAGCSVTISPGTSFKANYGAGYEYIVFKISRQALTAKLVAMTGAMIGEPLRMAARVDPAAPAAKTLQQYLVELVCTLSGAQQPLPAWWVVQTEQLLMAMFLCGHRHNYSHLFEQEAAEAAPWQVRKAEEYIEANWRRPITMDDLAEVTGINTFSLFRTFRRSRGYSPLDYARQVRSRQTGIG